MSLILGLRIPWKSYLLKIRNYIGDYNIDLLKTDDDDNIDEYYNIISSNFLVPHITLPIRITSTSRTLIDNIYSNNLNFVHAVSGNRAVSISDHLPFGWYQRIISK